MQALDCIFCHAPSDQIAIRENGFTGRRCGTCDLIFISPRPSYQEMLDYYSEGDGARTNAAVHLGLKGPKTIQAKYTLKLIRKHCPVGSLLELGAGAGHFLQEARRKGFQVFAIEPGTLDGRLIVQAGIPLETTPLHRESFEGKRFDVIYHCDVTSHFYDPLEEFRRMHDALVPDGVLAFETGNLGEVDEKYYKYFSGFSYPEHLFFFGERSLKLLLAQCGFECLAIHRHPLLPQLMIKKVLRRLERSVEAGPAKAPNNNDANASSKDGSGTTGIKQRVRSVWHSLEFLLRYKAAWAIPGFMLSPQRPQSLIVIARRR